MLEAAVQKMLQDGASGLQFENLYRCAEQQMRTAACPLM